MYIDGSSFHRFDWIIAEPVEGLTQIDGSLHPELHHSSLVMSFHKDSVIARISGIGYLGYKNTVT